MKTRTPKPRIAADSLVNPRGKGMYAVVRDDEGLTPRQRWEKLKGDAQDLENQKRRGELLERREVEKAHAEMVEVLRSDLVGALPLRLAGEMSGRKMTPQEVRAAVLAAVNDMLASWTDAEIPVPAPSAAVSAPRKRKGAK